MTETEMQSRLINIDKVLATKFPKKKFSPLIIKLINNILHVDELNDIIKHTDKDGYEFCEQTLKYLDIKIEIEGLENIPSDGTLYTFSSNHPLGAVDGITLCALIGRNYGEVKMLVNDFLLFLKPLAPLGVPVNKVGAQSRNLSAAVNNAFESNDQIFIFPAGICSRKIDGKVQDLPWNKTFITKSTKNNRKIVPVHFVGENSKKFYRIANICKALKIKFNIAMLFLPAELLKARGKTYKIIFGKPLEPEYFNKSKSAKEWAQYVRELVYKL